jgi:hypothetical protein
MDLTVLNVAMFALGIVSMGAFFAFLLACEKIEDLAVIYLTAAPQWITGGAR